MTEQHTPTPHTGEVAAPMTDAARTEAFERMLETKIEHGFTVESRDGTSAVLATRRSRRFFGLGSRAEPAREIVAIDAQGNFTSRKPS